ncbi:MAG: RNA-binding protein [archaeon]
MSKKLYVGNLPFSVNSEKLKELFTAYGAVEDAQVISFKDTGKSKGFGFVTITDDVQADKAKEEMNGKEVEGRKLFVNEAKPFDPDAPRKPRRSFGDRDGGGFGGRSGGFGGGRSFGGGRGRFNRDDRD